MKKVIRHGAFETNSSSSHTLALCTYGELEQLAGSGVIEIVPGEFGWEWENYYDFYEKASYALTHALNYWDESIKALHLAMLRRVIEEFTGREVEFTTLESEFYPNGYIDHQSYSDAAPYKDLPGFPDADVGAPIWESDDHLRHFLFNPRSAIITGNDND